MSREKPEDYYRAAYPEVVKAARQLQAGDASGLETALQFLEQDPYAFGTGYMKSALWKYLGRVSLEESGRTRLRRVALHYVETRFGDEFTAMCRFYARIPDPALEKDIVHRTEAEDPQVRRRALIWQAYQDGYEAGERYRKQASRNWQSLCAGIGPSETVKKPGKPRWKDRSDVSNGPYR